jgi:hypothetical protein
MYVSSQLNLQNKQLTKENNKMSKTEDQEMPTTFPKKWLKLLKDMPEFKDTADSSSVEDLKKIVLTSEGNIYTIEAAKLSDIKLEGAKELVKEMTAPYTESLRVQMAKIKYALFCLEGKGEDLNNTEN